MTPLSIPALFPELQEISNASLRTQVINTWARAIELGGWSKVQEIPFTLMHPTTATLIDHTRQVTALAITIGDAWNIKSPKFINRDLLIAGGLLHDVGKLLEYERVKGTVVPRKGAIRHHYSGVYLAGEQGLPNTVLNCIAYHGQGIDPALRCREAIILHHCDFIYFELDKTRTG
jgi:putative nucleotidyltransferase with HDIG domain